MAVTLTGRNVITDAEFTLIAERLRYIADTAPTNFHEGKPCYAYYHPVTKETFERFKSIGIAFHKTPRTIRFYVPRKGTKAYEALMAHTKGMPADVVEAQKASIERMKKKAKEKALGEADKATTAKATTKATAKATSKTTAKADKATAAKASTKAAKADKVAKATTAKADKATTKAAASQPIAKAEAKAETKAE